MMRARLGVRIAALPVTLGCAMWGPTLAAADSKVEFTMRDERITESSGLTRDVDNDRYWTVNDSGDSGVAYAIDTDGRTEGTLRFRAEPRDVEAAAVHDKRLYIADIGDNLSNREFVTVYSFDDPDPDGEMRTYRAYDFSYPDGAHDAETLLVDDDGRLYVVTKEAEGGIYAAPSEPSSQGVNELERVGDAPGYVTDGTYLPDGERIALRTYASVEILDAETGATVARGATPIQPQGETITVSLDGDDLLLGSEGRRSKVYRTEIPTGDDPAPSASASPPGPSPSPSEATEEPASEDPTAEPAPTEDDSTDQDPAAAETDPGRRGTLLALGLAGVVAVVAGLVVAVVRKP